MYKGTIIENSLSDKNILHEVKIIRTWQSSKWTLHDVLIEEDQIPKLSNSLSDGPWYIHVWKPGNDKIKVIYKNKIFQINYSDKSTWKDAVDYGKSIGIPEEQLDFVIN
ncbi:MAG: hypothetical protein KBC78_04065 [Candidatus Pacebacteria bacterium]|nr:hypothetical protein [Candidatus Paceibacterota bacterium]